MADDIINALQQANRSSSVLQGIANPPQVNPLAAITAGNQAAQAELNTRKMQADQAAGRAFLNSIDPNTGQSSQAELLRGLQRDPTTAFAAQRSAQEGQTLDTGTYDLHNKRLSSLSSVMSDLLSRYPNGIPAEAAHAVIKQQLELGNITKEQAPAIASQFGDNPHENSKVTTQLLFRNLSNQQILEQTYGEKFRQTGPNGQTIGGTQAPARLGSGVSGPPAGQPGLPLGQSPENLNQLVEIGTNPDGTKRMGTQRQAQNMAAGRAPNDDGPSPAPGQGAAPGQGGGGPPGGALPPGMYRDPRAGNQILPKFDPVTGAPMTYTTTPPVMPPGARPDSPATHGRGPAAALPLVPPPAAGFNTGQPPAQRAAQETTGTASANKFQTIVDQGVRARSQDALLATMLSEAQAFRPGPGADTAASIKRTILGIGAQFGTTFGIDEKKLASMESVIKIGNQLADAQGAGSDARLKVSEGANPSIHNTLEGLNLIIRQLRGNADYLRVRQQLAAAYPDKSDIEGFESKIGANLDPRVFQYERLAPEQRAEYYHGMTDKAAFRKAHEWAAQRNLFAPGG